MPTLTIRFFAHDHLVVTTLVHSCIVSCLCCGVGACCSPNGGESIGVYGAQPFRGDVELFRIHHHCRRHYCCVVTFAVGLLWYGVPRCIVDYLSYCVDELPSLVDP